MKFQCAGITESVIDGYGISLVVWFSGCHIKCPFCQNQELQDENYGYKENTKNIIGCWEQKKDFYDSIVFLGGEPLEQRSALLDIALNVKGIKFLYTGFVYADIPSEIIDNIDVIIAGPYVDFLKTNSFPASSNQKIIFQGEELINANKYELRRRIRQII